MDSLNFLYQTLQKERLRSKILHAALHKICLFSGKPFNEQYQKYITEAAISCGLPADFDLENITDEDVKLADQHKLDFLKSLNKEAS